jgi:hypothetical protein
MPGGGRARGNVARVRKLLVAVAVTGLVLALALRRSAGRQHGTPDHWPAVVRKP